MAGLKAGIFRMAAYAAISRLSILRGGVTYLWTAAISGRGKQLLAASPAARSRVALPKTLSALKQHCAA